MFYDHMCEIKEKRLFLTTTLIGLIFQVKFIVRFWMGSLAFLSYSAYALRNNFALGQSYLAIQVAKLPINNKHTCDYHRIQVLDSLPTVQRCT
jgi:Co/Zn/Cd efflux system component